MDFFVFESTHIGDRGANQDASAYHVNAEHGFFVVADGLGGHAQGEIASHQLCQSLLALESNFIDDIEQSPVEGMHRFLTKAYAHMREAIIFAHGQIDTHTTLACAWCDKHATVVANVGDSRVYRIYNDSQYWRTRDHTPVQGLFESGKLSEDEMKAHPLQNRLDETINLFYEPVFEIHELTPLDNHETLVLCTDGVWSQTNIASLLALGQVQDIQAQGKALVSACFKEGKGVSDNMTIQIIRLDN